MPERSAIMCVTQIVDEQKVGFLVLKIVFFTVLVQLAGGCNLAAMSHAAPALIRGISELGALLSASLVGMLFGAPLLGYAGDRFGRRRAIIWGTLIYYALATLGMRVAHNGSSHQQTLVLCA